MKILIVTERYWPEVGAAPSRLDNMAQGFINLGNNVEVLTSLPNYPAGKIYDGYKGCLSKHEKYCGADIFRYWIYATVKKSTFARMLNMFSFALIIWFFAFKRKRIKSYDAIIIQTPTLVVAVSAMIIFKKLYRKKCVLNVSDIWPSTAVDLGVMKEGSFSHRFMSKCEVYLYRNADAILGQSQEILDHIKHYSRKGKLFLYRNLQPSIYCNPKYKEKGTTLKILFCGMLGVAQNVAEIVKKVPFRELGVEFHIIGGGQQLNVIKDWCKKNKDSNIFTYGFVPKDSISSYLSKFDVSIVPLATRIRGAVPSKIYDILPQGIPILFCGQGEAATFILDHQVGFVCDSEDYAGLVANIVKMRDMDNSSYNVMRENCIKTSCKELDFKKQMKECMNFLLEVIQNQS